MFLFQLAFLDWNSFI